MIVIVDYGMGNLRSVQKGFERVGAVAEISRDPAELAKADKIVLPGVGAFRDAMAELQRCQLVEPLLEAIRDDKPFLGICLGLQLLFDVSYEGEECRGLGVIPGKVVRFDLPRGFKVPHMGWNQAIVRRPAPLLEGIQDGDYFYFVHSYYVVPDDPARRGDGGRLRGAFLCHDLAGQSLCDAVSPGEEPGQGTARAGELRPHLNAVSPRCR